MGTRCRRTTRWGITRRAAGSGKYCRSDIGGGVRGAFWPGLVIAWPLAVAASTALAGGRRVGGVLASNVLAAACLVALAGRIGGGNHLARGIGRIHSGSGKHRGRTRH